MAMGPIRCALGFSIERSNDFSEELERRSTEMEAAFRDGFFKLQLGVGALHDAIDAALVGDERRSAERLDLAGRCIRGRRSSRQRLGHRLQSPARPARSSRSVPRPRARDHHELELRRSRARHGRRRRAY